jgi:hypothetical protein
MPDTKITALSAIVTVDPVNDVLPIVDVSDTSMAASGTTKKVTTNQLLGAGATATLGTLAVSGATTLTGALTANGAVTLGDAVGDAVSVNGSLTAYRGEVASAIRGAAAGYAGVACDGATSNTRVTSACQSVGTGDFSIWVRARIPSTAPGNTFTYAAIGNNSSSVFDSTGAFTITQEVTGSILVSGYLATVFTTAITASGVVAAYAGQIVDIVFTRATSGGVTTGTLYINGFSVGTSTAAVVATSVTSNFFHVGAAAGGQCNTQFYRAAFYNRALSATDVTDLIERGVDPSDMWGTTTATYTSDFSAGTDSWTSGAVTLTGNVDGIGSPSTDNTMSVVPSVANTTHLTSRLSILTPSRRFRLTGSVFLPAAQTNLTQVEIQDTGSLIIVSGALITPNASWQSINTEFVARGISLVVYAKNGTNFTYAGNGTDLFYLHGFTVTRIGAVVNLNFEVGAGFQATDNSTNSLHGTLFGGTSWTRPRNVAVLYATTNTSGNQQMLGTTAIPTNAIIEDLIVNSTGSCTVSVGNASGGTQIVNAASVVSGRQKLTLATPFSSTGNLWVNSSTTATLQFTILYTMAA